MSIFRTNAPMNLAPMENSLPIASAASIHVVCDAQPCSGNSGQAQRGTTHRAKLRWKPRCQRVSSRRDGALLLIVLVTIVVLSLSAYTFTTLMQTEEEATRLMTLRLQTKYLADSGLDYTRMYLANSDATIRENGGRWNNEERFRGIPVAADVDGGGRVGYFSVVTYDIDTDGLAAGSRFGLVDESSKINLNTLVFSDALQEGSAREILMTLPEMTEEIADAILDWLDSDDDTRDFGVETDYYQGLSPAYAAKNGPMDSLDELLLIPGITPQLLFGLDTNRNGVLDPAEAASNDISVNDSDLYLGWSAFLTLYSKESNLTAEGLPRININADDLEQLYDDLKSTLPDEWANMVILYRCAPSERIAELTIEDLENDVQTLEASRVELDFGVLESQRKFDTILDLFNLTINVGQTDGEFAGVATPDDVLSDSVKSPVTFINMGLTIPLMMQSLTTFEGLTIPGRVNIMQAPRRVLLAIPGLDEDTVDLIIERRGTDFELDDPDGADLNRRYETWLMVEGLLDPTTMKSLMKYVCAGGDVYRAEIVGYFPDGIATSRAEAVIDTTVPVPRVLFWRDKSHLQTGYSIETLGVDLQ